MTNLTLFSQIIKSLNKQSFKNLVNDYQADKHNKGITSWTHLVIMLFLHFSACNSLREVCNGMKSAAGNLIHLGVLQSPSKSSLSYINQNRTWELFKEFYFKLLDYFSKEAGFKQKKFRIKKKIYLIDSTIVSLCLSLYDWALYRTAKGGIKLHTVLDFDSCLPVYVHVTDAKTHDSKAAEAMPLSKGAVAVVDRAYLNFQLLYNWTLAGVFFVTRLKNNIKYNKLDERELPDNKAQQILIDEYIELSEENTKEKYPKKLRRVVVYNTEKNQSIELLTNNFTWTAETISELYKSRWQIEIFFKEIKQLLNIKSFVGTSANAVMIQIWTAMITILILKYLKHKANYNWNLSNLVSYLRLNIFVKLELIKVLNSPFKDVVSDIKEMHPELEFY